MVACGSCLEKALRFVTDDDDARGRCFLLEGVIVVLLFVSELRLKTFVWVDPVAMTHSFLLGRSQGALVI